MNNEPNTITTSSTTGSAICHAVPCHISYTGPSSGVDIFFNPTDIITPPSTSTNTNTDGTNVAVSNGQSHNSDKLNDSKSSYQAAMIRGRGLLARCSEGDTGRVYGHVVQVVDDVSSSLPPMMTMNHHGNNTDESSFESPFSQQGPQKRLQSIQSFDRYVEWYHEHQTSMIPSPNDPNTRYHRAMEWMNTANCLHAPLPIPK